MTDYKTIFGKKIKFLTSDLDNAEGEGQLFYSNTDSEFKVAVTGKAWSSGSNLGTARYSGAAGGIQTASFLAGGANNPPFATKNSTEEYNGSGWASGGNIGTARYRLGGCGTLTAGIVFGGNYPARKDETETYDGTSWTEVGDINTARMGPFSAGTQTAALCASGATGPSVANSVNSEEWNGSSWTEGDNMNAARRDGSLGAGGTQTAAIAAGGTGDTDATEEYDGSSWTSVTNLPAGRSGMGVAGIQTNCIHFGGPAQNLEYDGTSWTAGGAPTTLGTARSSLPGSGTASAALGSGGNPGSAPYGNASTEEFNVSAMTITAGAWASGEAINQIRRVGAGTGTQTSGMIFGGFDAATALGHTEQYDGTDWTEVGDLNTSRGKLGSATGGSQTASLAFGGSTAEPSNPGIVDNSEEFNGSSWAEGDNINTGRFGIAGAGTQTAGLGFGGYTPGANRNESEEYNGTSWTEGDNLGTARYKPAGCGTQTAALGATGYLDGGVGPTGATEEYDGTSWTNVNTCPEAQHTAQLAGTQTDAIIFGGSPNRATTLGYDGTNWSTRPSMGTGRDYSTGFGTGTAAVCAGANGGSPGDEGLGTVEEFTGDTASLNLKTITDS